MKTNKRKLDPYLDRRSYEDRRIGHELGYFISGGIEKRKYLERRIRKSNRRIQHLPE